MAVTSLIGASACSPLAGTSVDKGYYISQKNARNQPTKPSDSTRDNRIETLIFSKSEWNETEIKSRSRKVSKRDLQTLFAEGSVLIEPGSSTSTPVALSFVLNGDMNDIEAECQTQQNKIIESLAINLVQLQSWSLSWAESESTDVRNCASAEIISAHLVFAANP